MIGVAEGITLLGGTVVIVGAVLTAQWLYYWPKVQQVVEKAVGEAMKREHDYVQREINRIDSRHTGCLLDRKKEVEIVDKSLREDITYIRGRIDWLIAQIMKATNGPVTP